jgi:hypothetical protein
MPSDLAALRRRAVEQRLARQEAHELLDPDVLLLGVGVHGGHQRLAVEHVDDAQDDRVELDRRQVRGERQRAADVDDLAVVAPGQGLQPVAQIDVGARRDDELVPGGVDRGPRRKPSNWRARTRSAAATMTSMRVSKWRNTPPCETPERREISAVVVRV